MLTAPAPLRAAPEDGTNAPPAAAAQAVTNAAAAAPAAPPAPAPAATAADAIVALLTEGQDPFQYGYHGNRAAAGDGGMIPVDTRSISADVRVRGLVRVAGRSPAALLQVNPGEPPVLVRKGDVVFVPAGRPAADRRRNAAPAAEALHLLVDEIRDDCVLVAPKKNPEAVMMLR
jgi:hypothetical protein